MTPPTAAPLQIMIFVFSLDNHVKPPKIFHVADGGLVEYGHYLSQRGEYSSLSGLTFLGTLHLVFHMSSKTASLFFDELGVTDLIKIVWAYNTDKQVCKTNVRFLYVLSHVIKDSRVHCFEM